jgi:hypothetical protein
MEDDMVLPENRTEAERLLAAVRNYEDRSPRKSSLPRWLFALALSGTVLSAYGPSDFYAAVTTALTPSQEKPVVDAIAAANVEEDIDYRVAQHAKSAAGWHAFLEAHPDGPHAQAAEAEIERLLPTPLAQPVEVAEQTAPSSSPTTPVDVAESPAPPAPTPAMVEEEPSPPVQIAESPPAPAPQPVMVMREPAPPPTPVFTPPVYAPAKVADSEPLPSSRPREIAVAKSVEPTHHGHRRAEHHARHERIYSRRPMQEYATLSNGIPRAGQSNERFRGAGRATFSPSSPALAPDVKSSAGPQRLDRNSPVNVGSWAFAAKHGPSAFAQQRPGLGVRFLSL